jgi:hypothetical protein
MIKRTHFLLVLAIFVSTSLFAAPAFRDLCNDLADKSAGSSVVQGIDGWQFLTEELRHLGAGRFWGEDAARVTRTKNKSFADPLPAIVEYNQLLAEKGITLYLMPVPPKSLVYPEKLAEGVDPAAAAEERALYEELYGILEKSGVKSIDLLPTLLENRNKTNVYCKTDTHFSGTGLALFAEAAANVLKKEAWYPSVPKTEYQQTLQKVAIKGDLNQMSGGTGPAEELDLSVVSTKADGTPVESDPKSPVILLGDSHTLVFNAGGDLHAKGAGLFDHLSAQLGFPVDLLGVRGSGVTPARIKLFQRSKKDGNYLAGKKALIWCFAARDFTGTGGWRKIPAAP